MQLYEVLYPYAVICMAIAASVSTIVGGLYAFITMMAMGRFAVQEQIAKKAKDENTYGDQNMLQYVLGGTVLFVGACLSAMIELKIGAWVASIGCSSG